MTEVEREAILYERAQARLAKAERRELEKKMRALEHAESRPVRGPSADMEKKRRSLRELKARRERKRRHGESDSEYSAEEGETQEEEGEVKKGFRTRGKNSTSNLDSEYEDEGENGAFDRSTTKRLRSIENLKVADIVDLGLANRLLLCRNTLSKWIFHPEFDDAARGCFVRLAVNKGNEQVYRLVEIKKIVKYHKNYRLNEVMTNKAAILKYGRSEKTFSLDVTSNSEFTQNEFDRWLATLKEEHQPMITRRVAENRIATWKNLEDRPVSDEIVSAMVAAKRELGAVPRNLISEKTMLLHLRDEALELGNMDEVDRIDAELIKLAEDQAQQQKNLAENRLEALAEINKRNRRKNVSVGMTDQKVVRSEADVRLDPFSRRKCQPTNFNAYFEYESSLPSRDGSDNAVAEKEEKDEKSPLTIPKDGAKKDDKEEEPSIDLFTAHNVDIEIDL